MNRRFVHWLNRQVSYEAMLVGSRRDMHTAVAQAQEAQRGWAPSPSDDDLRADITREPPRFRIPAASALEMAAHWAQADSPLRAGLVAGIAAAEMMRTSAFDTALRVAREASERLQAAGDVAGSLAAAAHAGRALHRMSRYDDAERYLRDAIASAESHPDAGTRVALHLKNDLAWALYRLSRLDESRALAESTLAAARATGNEREEIRALNVAGAIGFTRGEHATALEAHGRCLDKARASGDAYQEAVSQQNLANSHWGLGDHPAAVECFGRSLEIRRRIGDRHGEAQSLNGCGAIFLARGRIAEARAALERSVAIQTETGDRHGLAFAIGNLGQAALQAGDAGEALRCQTIALELRRAIGDLHGQALAWCNLISVHALREANGESIEAGRRAVEIADRLNAGPVLAMSLALRSGAHRQAGDRASARADAERALQVGTRVGFREGIVTARTALGLCLGDASLLAAAAEEAAAVGLRYLEGEAHLAAHEVELAAGNRDAAIDAARRAARIGDEDGFPHLSRAGAEALVALGVDS